MNCDHIPVPVVVMNHFQILECDYLFCARHHDMMMFLFTHHCKHPIGGHDLHYVVTLSHAKNVEWHAIQLTFDGISSSNGLVCEVGNDILTRNMLWPVCPFWIRAWAKTPFFFNSANPCNTQNPESRTKTLPVP